MSKKSVKTVDVCGDVLAVRWTGSVWVSPHNGRQHARAEDAMRSEVEAYLLACGEEPSAEELDNIVSNMEDGEE